MKLAFTTLGCPEWDLDTILAQAVAMDFDGVDFRGYGKVLQVYELPEFSTRAAETAARFRDAGLEVPCFASSARAFNSTPEARQASLEEVRYYAPLCQVFGTPYIRVFGGAIGDIPPTVAIESAVADLHAMFEIACDYGARILVETHDDWVDSDLLHRLIGDLDGDLAGVLWDVHHPYRLHGEPPPLTWLNLGRFVEYTHWKDSRPDPNRKEGYVLTHFGQGDLPVAEFLELLRNGKYDGYLTFEWEKRWHPDLSGPEEAFPIFVREMRRLLAG
jgi:sugar phosphate isomerase/epimerase